MARPFEPKIVSANDLIEGHVVYLTPDGTWSADHAEAAVAHTQDAADEMLARAAADGLRVVGPYLVTVRVGSDGTPEPTHFRERFRLFGPSVRRDVGRQAESARS